MLVWPFGPVADVLCVGLAVRFVEIRKKDVNIGLQGSKLSLWGVA